jgi:flagellar basal body-associated protein FliL
MVLVIKLLIALVITIIFMAIVGVMGIAYLAIKEQQQADRNYKAIFDEINNKKSIKRR